MEAVLMFHVGKVVLGMCQNDGDFSVMGMLRLILKP